MRKNLTTNFDFVTSEANGYQFVANKFFGGF
jgi:hypothetical protein